MWIIDTLTFVVILLLFSTISTVVVTLVFAVTSIVTAISIANRASNCTNEEAHDKIDS